jgi:cell division protein FtsI/penicillin-binding protein 2
LGNSIAIAAEFTEDAKDGDKVVLTIDRAVQDFVEQKLRAAVDRFHAKAGSVIVMDPYSGEIIAMASLPDFDPNNYGEVKNYDFFTSQAISSAYEPGSIFKTIAMAAALNEGVVTPDTTETFGAYVEVDGQKIWTATRQAYGRETMTQVLENSDNVAMVWVIQKLGKDAFYRYLRAFGYGVQTGVEMENEATGFVKSKHNLPEIDFVTMSFGQGIMVTPIQFVTSLACVANGGKLIQPHIVKKIIRENGKEEVTQSKVIREVLTPKTARQVGEMMVSVVENGHGKQARVKGYNVAGKTGTAQVADENGVYSYSKHIGSFGGFAPLEDPRFVMLVRLDEPQGVAWAEESAAPLFGEIASFLLKYYQVPPTK